MERGLESDCTALAGQGVGLWGLGLHTDEIHSPPRAGKAWKEFSYISPHQPLLFFLTGSLSPVIISDLGPLP